jgi:hypothetical protein
MRRKANIIMLTVGALLLLGAAMLTISRPARYLMLGEKANGIVVDVDWRRGTGAPIVEYATRNGEVRRYVSSASDDSPYEIGTRVAVRYFEQDAKAAIISSSFLDMWFGPTMLTAPGLILVGIAVAQRGKPDDAGPAQSRKPAGASRAQHRKAARGRRL